MSEENPYPELEGLSLRELAQEMKHAGEMDERLKAEKAHWYKKWDYIRKNMIPQKMEEEGIERVSYEGIGRIQLAGDMYIQTVDKGGLAAWLHAHDSADLIQPTVNGSSLKSYLKQCIEKGDDIPDDNLVKVTPFTRASIVQG